MMVRVQPELVLVLIVAAATGCSATTSIYRRPEVEARVLNMYEERLAEWPVPVESRYVGTPYGLVHVLVSGPKDAPPVLMLHAMGITATMWRANVADLSRHRRVYCVDYIGDLGRSRLYSDEHPGDGASAAAFVAELMDQLGIAQSDVVGASYGGWVALNLAVHRPDRVRRLALVGPMGIAPVTADAMLRLASLMLAPTESKKRDMVAWALGDDARVRGELEQYMLAAMDANGRLAPPYELSDSDLARIRAPVLLVLGEKDGPVGPPSKSADRARRTIARLQVLVVSGAAHLLSVERAEVVNEALVKFVSEQGPVARSH